MNPEMPGWIEMICHRDNTFDYFVRTNVPLYELSTARKASYVLRRQPNLLPQMILWCLAVASVSKPLPSVRSMQELLVCALTNFFTAVEPLVHCEHFCGIHIPQERGGW